MRRRVLPTGAVAALSFTLLAAANLAAQGAGPYVCMTRDFTKRVAYVSRVFNVQQADAPKVNPAWNQVMTSTYGITALPYQSCQGPYPSVALADSTRTRFIDNITNTFHQQVNQLQWTYGGAPALTVPASTPATTASATTSAPKPPATITDADRSAFQAEVPQSKAYCDQNYAGLFDCDCFAQAVLHHRLAHPEEMIRDHDGARRPPVHDLAIGIQYKLDCTECLDDARLRAWAHKQAEGSLQQQVMTKMLTQAQADRFSDCVAKAFPAKFRATPTLGQELNAYNAVYASCGNPRAS
ncbi:MAG TPA: hypothetical protein VL157_12865 [Gemmatimonadaceae bacterium]|jgi:hypothetical protein|nr:hypothetical protein [Gemmatimonadaceae bacterium]